MKIHEKDPNSTASTTPPSPLKRRRLSSKRKFSHDAEMDREERTPAKKVLYGTWSKSLSWLLLNCHLLCSCGLHQNVVLLWPYMYLKMPCFSCVANTVVWDLKSISDFRDWNNFSLMLHCLIFGGLHMIYIRYLMLDDKDELLFCYCSFSPTCCFFFFSHLLHNSLTG